MKLMVFMYYYNILLHYLLIFFSSRRRHTRYWRDWSSDVCSSDLCKLGRTVAAFRLPPARPRAARQRAWMRSEERRVGKECKSRWQTYQQKKKVSTKMLFTTRNWTRSNYNRIYQKPIRINIKIDYI